MKSIISAATLAVSALGFSDDEAPLGTYPNCGVSERQAWEDLSCEERDRYIWTVRKMKDDGIYGDFSKVHQENSQVAHGVDGFLPWHRWFLWKFEEKLQEYSESCMTLPYWQWEQDYGDLQNVTTPWSVSGWVTCDWIQSLDTRWRGRWCDNDWRTGNDGSLIGEACCVCGGGTRFNITNSTGMLEEQCDDFTEIIEDTPHEPNAAIFHPKYFGSQTNTADATCVPDGVASKNWSPSDPRARTRDDSGTLCLAREFADRSAPSYNEADVLDLIMSYDRFDRFRQVLEGAPHSTPHVWVGGSMGNMYSPDDPIFVMHHANVDRIWALWQDYHDHDLVHLDDLNVTHYSGRVTWRGTNLTMDASLIFEEPLSLNFNMTADGIEETPCPRFVHHSNGGTVKVKYVNDRLAHALKGEYNANHDWVRPAEESMGRHPDGICVSWSEKHPDADRWSWSAPNLTASEVPSDSPSASESDWSSSSISASESDWSSSEISAPETDWSSSSISASESDSSSSEIQATESDWSSSSISASESDWSSSSISASESDWSSSSISASESDWSSSSISASESDWSSSSISASESDWSSSEIAGPESDLVASSSSQWDNSQWEWQTSVSEPASSGSVNVIFDGRVRVELPGREYEIPPIKLNFSVDIGRREDEAIGPFSSPYLQSKWNKLTPEEQESTTKKAFIHEAHLDKCRRAGNNLHGIPLEWMEMNNMQEQIDNLLCDPTGEIPHPDAKFLKDIMDEQNGSLTAAYGRREESSEESSEDSFDL